MLEKVYRLNYSLFCLYIYIFSNTAGYFYSPTDEQQHGNGNDDDDEEEFGYQL